LDQLGSFLFAHEWILVGSWVFQKISSHRSRVQCSVDWPSVHSRDSRNCWMHRLIRSRSRIGFTCKYFFAFYFLTYIYISLLYLVSNMSAYTPINANIKLHVFGWLFKERVVVAYLFIISILHRLRFKKFKKFEHFCIERILCY